MKSIIISNKRLTTENKYAYCPYCYEQYIQQCNQSVRIQDILPKLSNLKELEIWTDKDGIERKYIEEYQKCDRCGRKIKTQDFINAYTVRADGTKWNEPPLEQGNVNDRTELIR